METLYPYSALSNSNWFIQERHSTEWTKEENKKFESALAIYDETTPDRWVKVAAMIPGKSVYDVMKQYKELEEDVSDIEAGRVPIPGYFSSSFTLELMDDHHSYRKRPLTARGSDHERKKGVPWTEDEHRRFLMGLVKYGKGDWRNISRNFVVSKTATQVASHAQKYFMRQVSGGKDKRRPSIHDITTVNLTQTTLPEENRSFPLDQSCMLQRNIHKDESAGIVFGNLFMSSSPYDLTAYDLKLWGQNLYEAAPYSARTNSETSMFRVGSSRYQKC